MGAMSTHRFPALLLLAALPLACSDDGTSATDSLADTGSENPTTNGDEVDTSENRSWVALGSVGSDPSSGGWRGTAALGHQTNADVMWDGVVRSE